MVQFLSDIIDQLDLALDQLTVKDRNFDRFAFMLIDNIVELTLFQFVQDRASENNAWSSFGKPKIDPKEIQKASGQHFDAKVKFASKMGLFDKTICQSIFYLHVFRNTTYHKGLRHENILHSIALFYFIISCDILNNYKPLYRVLSSSDVISYRASKYLGKIHISNMEEVFSNAFKRLKEIANSMINNFIDDLYTDMSKTIEYTDNAIDFLANDSPKTHTRNEVIIYCQAWSFSTTTEAEESYKKITGKDIDYNIYVDWLAKNHDWEIKSDPIPNWKKRLSSLKSEKDFHLALKKYCDFMKQTEDFRFKIIESAEQLDMYIQTQIEIARGK